MPWGRIPQLTPKIGLCWMNLCRGHMLERFWLWLQRLQVCATVLWRQRHQRGKSSATELNSERAAALALALTVLVVPMYAPYNQVLLLPAILVLVRDRTIFFSRSRGVRFLYLSGAVVLAWQWIASLSLCVASLFVSRTWALNRWQWPFLATFALPVIVFALIFLDTIFLRVNLASWEDRKLS